ncbi:hypothetical protein ACH5RR_003627 [Cinchona calisaya]|uniref:WAT1-related protein n=1 Tax=Cinchona calisaya TaxID=153742 RepID=A0ABD3AVC9_9GENT
MDFGMWAINMTILDNLLLFQIIWAWGRESSGGLVGARSKVKSKKAGKIARERGPVLDVVYNAEETKKDTTEESEAGNRVLSCALLHIVTRVALNIGVRKIFYPIYRNIIALVLLGPMHISLKSESSHVLHKLPMKYIPFLTFSFLVQFFLLALVGIIANQGFCILGLYYASPTFASAMQNSLRAITFIIAYSMGIDQVKIARRDGLAKILRSIASVGGATIITLYRGPPLVHQRLQSNMLQEDMFLFNEKAAVTELDMG